MYLKWAVMVTVPLISIYCALFITSLPSRVSEGSRKLAVTMDVARGPSSCVWPSSPGPGALWILGLSVVGLACKGHTAVLIVSRDLDEALLVFLKPLSFVQVTQFHSGSRALGQSCYLGPLSDPLSWRCCRTTGLLLFHLHLCQASRENLYSFSSLIIFSLYPRIPFFNVKSSLGTWRRIWSLLGTKFQARDPYHDPSWVPNSMDAQVPHIKQYRICM